MPTKGTRWVKFNRPQNIAPIVTVTHILDNGWIRTDPLIFENNETRNYWTAAEFSNEFRPI